MSGLEAKTSRTRDGSWGRPGSPIRAVLRPSSLCLLLLLAALAAPASAQAAFGAAQTLSEAGFSSSGAQVGVDPDGDAVVVWTRLDSAFDSCASQFGECRVQARARSAGGALSAIQTLSGAGAHAFQPQVAVDAQGDAVFVWTREDGTGECEGGTTDCLRVQARARSAAGTLSPVQTLSAPGQHAHSPRVGIDADGDAVFVWAREFDPQCSGSCYRIQTRARSAGGTLSAIQTLSSLTTYSQEPRVGVDADGDAVFAWLTTAGSDVFVRTRARSANGTLSAVQTLSLAGRPAFDPEVAVAPGGGAVFAWRNGDPATDCDGLRCQLVQARARSASGTLSTIQTVSSPPSADDPQVAVDASGGAVFTWERDDGTTECGGGQTSCIRAQARARSASGSLSAVQNLSLAGRHADTPHVGVDADGNAVFVWRRQFPTVGSQCGAGCFLIQARSRSAAGVLSGIQNISAAPGNAASPQVAVDPNGGLDPNSADAVAVWERFDGAGSSCCFRIQAAAQTAP